MQPVLVTIRDIPHSIALEDHIRQKAEKLTHFCQRINSCRVLVKQSQRHKHQGKLFNVRIDMTVPGKELVVNRKKNEDVYVAIRDAFWAMERQLETYIRKHRGHVKSHEQVSKGIVRRVLPEEGYGFIQAMDGTEYYFSDANVAHPSFKRLKVGDVVDFLSVYADEGPQANRVTKERHEWLDY